LLFCILIKNRRHHDEMGKEGEWMPSKLVDPDVLIDYMESGLRDI
jgi:hypothetical protein